jgi:hypothetical protein
MFFLVDLHIGEDPDATASPISHDKQVSHSGPRFGFELFPRTYGAIVGPG